VANCSNYPLGLVPLNDLGTGFYNPTGNAPHQGGLYANGSNYRLIGHERLGREAAMQIEPLDPLGYPASNGMVGFVALGHSMGKKIFDQMLLQMNSDPDKWPLLKPINACVAGRDAIDLSSLTNPYWTTEVPAALALANTTPAQVQVVWMMSGVQSPQYSWPANTPWLRDLMITCVQNAKTYFPNLKQLWLSVPHYEGYKLAPPSTEPWTYESGFAVKDLIELQTQGDDSLNFRNPNKPIVAPWVSWGGYFWTDGAVARTTDGLYLTCPSDMLNDGVHTSVTGSAKLADYLLGNMKADACCYPWYMGISLPDNELPSSPGITGTLGH